MIRGQRESPLAYTPMSEVAGRMAVQVGAQYLEKKIRPYSTYIRGTLFPTEHTTS